MKLQFGTARPGLDYIHRPAVFGIAERDGRLACVRVDRGEGGVYYDLPGGALDGDETEQQALVREFAEETGLIIQPVDRLTEAGQYFLKSDGAAVNNVGGVWVVSVTGADPSTKQEADHELVWMEPLRALFSLRHEAHSWAVARWLRDRHAAASEPQRR
ncbi:NUDIX domain-containing protein [Brevundimonas diminuta]|uniref:NUDIX hydrolase n=1 Tax=Brevundimonas naejangsanensis TaxID=588932 RepID=A0A172Y334_9CAUL|nr:MULTISPECIES: NUDIX domain-containing protein [Brevundimonas]ANF53618.1 NUDIX hydrolase [Brevundimonas naejangsanensis]MCO8028348.1 NUDIX domain-containing protein [Brevundimonas diminuta]